MGSLGVKPVGPLLKIKEYAFDLEINGLWYTFIADTMNVSANQSYPAYMYDFDAGDSQLVYENASFSGKLIPKPAQPITVTIPIIENDPEPEEEPVVAEFRNW